MKDTGGPMFPLPAEAGADDLKWRRGAMLRDYFAAQAMPHLISLSSNRDGEWDTVAVAVGAYQMADAMLAARKDGGA